MQMLSTGPTLASLVKDVPQMFVIAMAKKGSVKLVAVQATDPEAPVYVRMECEGKSTARSAQLLELPLDLAAGEYVATLTALNGNIPVNVVVRNTTPTRR